MKTKIYVLEDVVGEIRYVGKTSNTLSRRLFKHLSNARKGMRNHRYNWICSLLSKDFLPKIELIGEVDGNGSKEEIAWIDYGRKEGWRLVNGTDGGDGCQGYKHTEKTKQIISRANKGKLVSQKTRRKISEANKSYKHCGHSHSEETKRKIGRANKGKTLGRHLSEKALENLRKFNKGNQHFKGHHHSETTKQKMSIARENYYQQRKAG